jgi:transcriptional repressor NrdR
MKCPYCTHNEDRVLDTREQREGEMIRRRRECLKCKARFSTVETLSVSFPLVIKKDGRREPFSKDNILRGLQAACQKRAISQAQLDAAVERISNWIIQRGEKEVSAQLVGQKVMQELRQLDDVAYIRFASVYRTFKDVQEFVETLEGQEALDIFESSAQLALGTERTVVLEKSANETPSPRDRSSDLISN